MNSEVMHITTNHEILLIGCGILKKEVHFLIQKNKWPLDTLFFDSALHIDFEKLSHNLISAIVKHLHRNILVFYGCCHPLMENILKDANTIRTQGQNCVEMLLGNEVFTDELSKGAFFLLEDWAVRWDHVITQTYGSNQTVLRDIFQNDRKYLLGINTPCSGDFKAQAEQAAMITGLPLRWIDVSLDRLESVLSEAITRKLDNNKSQVEKEDLQLKDRLKKLAMEKADLSLLVNLMSRMSEAPGLENTVETMLRVALETIGGTHIEIHYQIDNQIYYADVFGVKKKLDHIDDPLVKKAYETRQAIEEIHDFNDTKIIAKEFTKANTLAFPLQVGSDVIGVFKIENMYIDAQEFQKKFGVFFHYVASILKNEISSQTALKKINDRLNKTNSELENEIIDRKKVEDELLRLLSLHDATLEATADGILVVDLNGKVVAYNQKFLQLWHISETLAAARDDEKLLAYVSDQLTSPDEFLAETKRLYACSEESSFDLLAFNDGRVFERSSQPQRIGEKAIGRVWSFRDITDRKNAEQATADAYTQLKAANKELISAQSQLIQSEKLSSIGQLAAGVAHEINNPVGFVSSNFETLKKYGSRFITLIKVYDEFLEEIQKSDLTEWKTRGETIIKTRENMKMDFVIEDIQSLFEDSREGLDRITKIIQSLRDFSRIDQVADVCEFDINEGIRDTLVVARNEIKYDCQIQTDFSDIPPITCNPGQINQVLLNIIVNAAQAIKSQNRQENGNILIKTGWIDDYVTCTIVDDGPGIPPGIITKIFDPFFTTKPVGKGTGLGLSISRDIIVNKHKGQLCVDSTVGKGTTFAIKLPIHYTMSESKEESLENEPTGILT